jgi:hypothetical protein
VLARGRALGDATGQPHGLAPGGACVSVDDGTPKLRREDLVLLGELATKGEIAPVIDRTYVLDDIVDAHRYVDNGYKRGNVVITVTRSIRERSMAVGRTVEPSAPETSVQAHDWGCGRHSTFRRLHSAPGE